MKAPEIKKFASFLFTGLLGLSAHGQTFQVTTTADFGPGSLRDAMTNAIFAGAGTIVFTNVSGTISLESALPDISVNVTIAGGGPANVTIDGNQLHRIFHIAPGIVCDISGLNLQHGLASTNDPSPVYSRAAIFNEGSLSLSNCFLHDNGPAPGTNAPGPGGGGALASYGISLVLNSVTISNNYGRFPNSAGLGASNVRATNCLFIKNRTDDGAPIRVGGDSVFSDSTFTQNTAWLTGEGGGISAGGNLTLLNCNVISNMGDHDVGGVYFNGNNLTISNCVINNNSSGTLYGGIKAIGNIVILNSSISGNRADSYGGIDLSGNAYLSGCTISYNRAYINYPGITTSGALNLNLTNCTISSNTAVWHAGSGITLGNNTTVQAVNSTIGFNGYGVENFGGTFYALNSIIAKNGTGPTNGDFSGTLTSQGYNIVGNLNTNTTIVGTTNGNIYGVDPLLGPLRSNGGPTLTHALMKGSPAIDAGTNAGAPLTDQRGVARPYGTNVDIGAFESEYNVLRFTDISRANSTNVHLQVEGLPGSICTFQVSSNFLDWDNLFVSGNNSIGVWEFVDQDAANHPNRFYRALMNH